MKIAVFSDTHGNTGKMLRTVEALRPDAVVHLGDYERDTGGLKKASPATATSIRPDRSTRSCPSVR